MSTDVIALEATSEKPQKNPKRAQVEAYLLDKIDRLDPTGNNGKFYRDLFAKMPDKAFDQWMQDIRDKKHKLIFWAPNMKSRVRMETILAIADEIGLKLFERLKLWDSTTRRWYLTPKAYLILRLPVRRLKQYLQSKISVPESDTTVDILTGQVRKPDAGSAVSLPETQTLLSKDLTNTIRELINVRGGNLQAWATVKSQLEETGSASMSEIDPTTRVRSAEVVNAFFHSMHLQSNF